jgi:pimeloyl-ACP methyl ester carboxylesterase
VAGCALVAFPAAAQTLAVGHTSLTFTDPARGNRQIPTEIYYPAAAPGENVPVGGPPGARYPVLSVGHGFLLPVSAYAYIWNGLVPAGYIVALPDTEGDLSPSHLDLGLDLGFVAAALAAESSGNPASLFYERVAAAAAAMGHSMGGGASFLAAAQNPVISALANLAAAETNPSAIQAAAQIEVPALVFAGSLDCVTPPAQHQIPMYNALAADCKTYVNVTGASHCQFAEQNFLCSLGEGGCSPPAITRAQQHALTLSLLRPWLDYALKADLGAWQQFQGLIAAGNGITTQQSCDVVAIDEAPAPDLASGLRIATFPDPFRNETRIRLAIATGGPVELAVHDVTGRLVRTLLHAELPAGVHAATWDGRDAGGRETALGVYFLRAATGTENAVRKVTRAR